MHIKYHIRKVPPGGPWCKSFNPGGEDVFLGDAKRSRTHDTYIRWLLINRCEHKEQSLLFDLYKAFELFESSHKSDIFIP